MPETKAKAQIIAVHPADQNNQVVTVESSACGYMKQPCAQCPWRKDQTGSFPAEAFRHSANTAYDMAREQFGCHMSGAERPMTCAGFLLNGSAHNLGARLNITTRQVDMTQVADGGHELHESYRAMAEANGVAPSDPRLRECRD